MKGKPFDTGNDLLALRMAARAKLSAPRPPILVISYERPNFQNGTIVQPPIPCDARLCRMGSQELRRAEDESYEEFAQRAVRELGRQVPVGQSGFILMVPPASETSPNDAN